MRGFQPDILAPYPKRSQKHQNNLVGLDEQEIFRTIEHRNRFPIPNNQKSKFDLYNFLWYNRDAVVEHTAFGFDFKFDISFRFHIHLVLNY